MRSGGLADLPAFARLSGAVEGGPVSRDDDAPDLALAAHLQRSTRSGGQDLNFSSGQLQSTATARGAPSYDKRVPAWAKTTHMDSASHTKSLPRCPEWHAALI